MRKLQEGQYTGEISNYLSIEGGVVSTTQYLGEEHDSDWHSHENLHFCFVFQGGGQSFSTCRSKKRIGNDVYFYPAGEKHIWIPKPGFSKSVNIELCNNFIETLDSDERQIGRALEKNIDAKFLMMKIHRELLFCDSSSRCSIHTLLLELVTLPAISFGCTSPHWVRRVAELIHDEWRTNFSLDGLSQAAGVHPVTISKYFRKYFFCTLGEYLRKLKIENSLSLVKNTARSLTEIALACGFSDQSHFTRTFKKITGFLPSEFRKV